MDPILETVNEIGVVGIVVTAVILFLTIIVLCIKLRKTPKNDVLLVGLSDAGKTLIFSQMVAKKYVDTQTSMKENISQISVGKKTLRLVDVPGNERLRNRYLDIYKPTCKAMVFVVDSMNLSQHIQDEADYLYSLLTEAPLPRAILILCNKQDQPMAKSSKAVQHVLEKEITTLCFSRNNSSATKDFQFSEVRGTNIVFGESKAIKEKGQGVQDIWDWLKTVS